MTISNKETVVKTTMNSLVSILKDTDREELLELSDLLTKYTLNKLKKKSDDKFQETIKYAKRLVKDIQSNLDLAEEIGELEWFSTQLDFQNQLIISCEDLVSVSKKLKLKGAKDV